jgi:membrane fusion protein, multidrug efflux system
MKTKNILLFLLALGLLSLIVYRIIKNQEKETSAPVNKGNGNKNLVEAVIAKPRMFETELTLAGSIEANESTDIRSEINGKIEYIRFDEGSVVAKGQVLLKVNDIELQAQLLQAKSKQNLASENERRAKLLLEKEAISQEEYDVARSEWISSKAQVQLIQAQISKTVITAPFSGKIGLRYVSPGSFVTSTSTIAKLVNSNQVKISFSVPEKYANAIEKEGKLKFYTSDKNTSYTAKIYAIEPEINTSTRTLQVRAICDNKDGKLTPGSFANIILPLAVIQEAILIPNEAIIPIQNGKKVFITENGKAKEQIIETGTRTEKEILVLSGLKPGDTVITSGIMALKNGTSLQLKIK